MYINGIVENNPKKNTHIDEIILKPLKNKPKLHETLGSYELIKGIFESIEIEQCEINIEEKNYCYPDNLFIITLSNPSNTVMVNFSVRVYFKVDGCVSDVYIGDLGISNGINIRKALNSDVNSKYYKTDYNNEIRKLVYNKAWDIISEKFNNEFDIEEKINKDFIEKTKSELKTINRSNSIEKIFK